MTRATRIPTDHLSRSSTMSRTRHLLVLAAPLAAAALVLAGCSSGGSDEPAATAAASAPAAANGDGAAPGGGRSGQERQGGGTSGLIAQVGDDSLQVRDDDGQTTVTWTDDTTFSATTTGTIADVTVGSCVVAITGGMPGTSDDDSTDAAAATTVTITAATDGECTVGGFGGRGAVGGDLPSGMPTDLPSGMPTDLPSGGARPGGAPTGGFGGFGGFTSGKVTAVDGSTITVDAVDQDGTTGSNTVTVDSSTTYSATAEASAKALVVGACATVQGKADDKGAVAATRVVVSEATDGSCTSGFGGGFAGRGGPGGPGAGQGDDSTQGSADA